MIDTYQSNEHVQAWFIENTFDNKGTYCF